jgi:uncharacterized damage-inducible protein DinB
MFYLVFSGSSSERSSIVTADALSLKTVYEGWDGYQVSLVHAIAPLSSAQLAYRPAPGLRSVGEITSHISLGRLGWFQRMQAPGSDELASQAEHWEPESAIMENAVELVRRLEVTWQMIENTLTGWTVADLTKSYRQPYQGKIYAVSHQWTIWRIMAHDLHHGGELAVMLGMQGINIPELGDVGGHITEIPLAEPSQTNPRSK